MLASFNKFDSNIQRTAIIVPVVNCLTSFFAGFVIFAYMGYLSHITGQDIDNIIEAGQGLAFVVYPFAGDLFTLEISIYNLNQSLVFKMYHLFK